MLEGEIGRGRGDQIIEATAGWTACPPQEKLSAQMARIVGWAILSCGEQSRLVAKIRLLQGKLREKGEGQTKGNLTAGGRSMNIKQAACTKGEEDP